MKNFSNRSLELNSSPLQNFFVKVKKAKESGADIISLGVGEPDCEISEKIKKASVGAVQKNKTKYLPASGSLALKKVLAKKFNSEVDEVVVSHGAKTIIGAVMWSLVNKGDVVLIPAPFYPPFVQVAKSLGAKVVFIDTKKTDFLLKADDVLRQIKKLKKAPKLLIINSPNNPTGAVYEKKELKKIGKLSREFGFTILSDECYNNFSQEKDFTFRQIEKEAVVVNSVSKAYAMTGIRIGWAICPNELAEKVRLYLENFVGCPCSVSDEASQVALVGKGIKDYSKQRKIMYDFLDSINIPYGKSSGGFYVFPDFSEFVGKNKNVKNSLKFAEFLFLVVGVAVIPGISFGDYNQSVRISYSVKTEDLRSALERIKRALKILE